MDVPSTSKMSSLKSEEQDYLVAGQSNELKDMAVPSGSLQIIPGEDSKGNFEFINIKMELTDDVGENNEETDDTNDVKPTIKMEIDADYNNATSNNSWSQEDEVKPDLQSIKIERCSSERDSEATSNKILFKDAEVQVGDSIDVLTCFSNIKKNCDISIVTGVKTLALVNRIVDKIETSYANKYEIPGRRFKTFDRVLLTCAKLKHELPFDVLSILFQCSIEDCKRIFLETEERLRRFNLIPK